MLLRPVRFADSEGRELSPRDVPGAGCTRAFWDSFWGSVARLPVLYNCDNCPAYCCSYEHIEVTDRDLERLARHFGISLARARERFSRPAERRSKKRVLRHRKDEHFGSVCRFLDREARKCSVYTARPAICRAYPGTGRCGFYDFLMSERRAQEDPEYVPSFTRG